MAAQTGLGDRLLPSSRFNLFPAVLLATLEVAIFIVADKGEPEEGENADWEGHPEDRVKESGQRSAGRKHGNPKPPSILQ